jgi:hypothetical protein
MKDILANIKKLKNITKSNKKISCVFIGNTAQKEKNSYYITPLRGNNNFIFFSIVIYSNIIAKKIAKLLDGNVDFIFVDIEKKIQTSSKNLKKNVIINIERTVKDIVKKTKLRVYKANDLTILAAETLINYYYLKDQRGIGGKKIAIIGAGNLGFKLALKLLESGGITYLFRRNRFYLKNLVKSLNIIKPKGTLSSAYYLRSIPDNLNNFDVIIGCSDTKNIIKYKNVKNIVNKKLLIDLGKGTFSKNSVNNLLKKNIYIYRLDITSSYLSFLENTIFTEKIYGNLVYTNKIKEFTFVSQGILGRANDIIVDNPQYPKKIFGVCDGKGNLKRFGKNEKKKIIKNIFKKIGFKIIYD